MRETDICSRLIREGLQYASTTRELLSSRKAVEKLPELFQRYYSGRKAVIVADENTWEAAGMSAASLLKQHSIPAAEPYIFPGQPVLDADETHAEKLAAYFLKHPESIPIAAGSGTINDLVKLAAHMAQRAYITVATAASVDGYASDGAAVLNGGSKITMPCPAPAVIIGDTDIISDAPSLLTSSGYADLLAKVPAGADWIFADLTGEDPVNSVSWQLVQSHLHELLQDPKDIEKLFTGLNLCGLAMQHQKDSRPVSGAEHLLSHVWEMKHHTHNGETVLHGIKVGIGTLISAAAMRWLIDHFRELPQHQEDIEVMLEQRKALLCDHFHGIAGYEQMHGTLQKKYGSRQRLEQRRNILNNSWDEISASVQNRLLPYQEIKQKLQHAGCPVSAEQIGMEKSHAIETLRVAQLIRNRYTILDVLDDLGVMEQCIEGLKADTHVLTE